MGTERLTLCFELLQKIRTRLESRLTGLKLQYSQTSIRALPLGVDQTGCYTQLSVLSRLSQKCHSGKKVLLSKLVLFHTYRKF